MIKNEKDGTVEIREKLQKDDEKELERKDISSAETADCSSEVDEDKYAKIMRLMDEAIEKEEEEKDMAEKLRKGGIVECQVGSLKFRVQPPSPKLKVNRVKELPPLSELVSAAEKEEEEEEKKTPPVASRSIDSDTFSGEIVERTDPSVMPTQTTTTTTTRTKPLSKFKRAMMQSRNGN